MKIAVPSAKNVLRLLAIKAAASEIDAGIKQKTNKKHGSGNATLVISNEEMNDIMKIIQALEDCNIWQKGVTKTIKNEKKRQKEDF